MKKLQFIQRNHERHWVGDGFPVRSVFSYNDIAKEMSPFLLLDYAGPEIFPAARSVAADSKDQPRRGVGEHPHRGFETVTIVYDGQVEHRDSSGGGGVIGPGDVQWMTAASGLVHDEFHGADFARDGGRFEMIQLWVNLPARDKSAAPGYQSISSAQIPSVALADDAGTARVIAGELEGARGPARTFTPVNLWDLKVRAGHRAELRVPDGHTASLFVLKGRIRLPSGEQAGEAELAVLERAGDRVSFEALEDSTLLFLGGEPIHEPIAAYGPFVMNYPGEIRQAMIDFQEGRMGRL